MNPGRPYTKVLVLSASAGAGHLRAANAVELALSESGAAREVRHVDTLEYTNKIFRRLYSEAYLDMVRQAPQLLGWLYDHLDKPFRNERLVRAFNKLNTRPFVKLIHEYEPEIIVCTHFLPSEIISRLKAKKRLTCPQAIVVTDLDVHAMWLCRDYEQYFVALEETRVHLEAMGVPAEKITVSGIPIDPVFSRTKDKQKMREKHGLIRDRTTILISAGGFGVGPIENLIASLLKLRHAAQIVAICGRNESLRARMDRVAAKLPSNHRVAMKVIGFTDEMDELMTASDILLGKPGGLTTSEALAKGLVFVIVNPIPGQEERNSDHLLEEGVAIRCNNLPALSFKIDRLLDDPARFASMQAGARRLARPRAAFDIAERLLDLRRRPA